MRTVFAVERQFGLFGKGPILPLAPCFLIGAVKGVLFFNAGRHD
jgi:hypothetical protein